MKNQPAGFTLIELMITVAIIAILAAIAYPSYREQIARGRRGDAQAALLSTAQWLERQYTITNAYNKKPDGSAINSAALPALNSRTAEAYALSFGNTTASAIPSDSAYSLRIVPQGAMSGDRCGTFTLDNTGAKAVSGVAGLGACWDR